MGYYQKNGKVEGVNWVLSDEKRRELLNPVYEACKHYGVQFCACVESHLFSGTYNCLRECEAN
jgi:hypothetical protein